MNVPFSKSDIICQASFEQAEKEASAPKYLAGKHDTCLAELLVERHGSDIVFDTTRNQWRVFSDGYWVSGVEAKKILIDYYHKILIDLNEHKIPNSGIDDADWIRRAMNQANRNATFRTLCDRVAKDEKGLTAKHDLIGIQDKVYDLSLNVVRPAKAEDLMFKSVGTSLDANADCTEWKSFLGTVMQGDSEMIGYLQRLTGYFLTTSIKEQQIYYFYGSGANGKSTFLDVIKHLLGDYSVKLPSAAVTKTTVGAQSTSGQASIANLFGARFALTDETCDSNVAFDAQILKSLSGDDEITGRHLRRNPITFKSTAKIVMYGNDKPYGNVNDEGFWRRFRFIHFDHVVPESQRDKDLLQKLKDELPGILNWALKGLSEWKRNGLQTPEKVIKDSADYREELDTVTEFLGENTKQDPTGRISTRELFEAYMIWCKENLKTPETMQGFSRRSKSYFNLMGSVDPFKTNKTRGYKGVSLDQLAR